jgi:Ubiquitin family
LVQHINIQEQDLRLPTFKERVHLWTTIKVTMASNYRV